MRIFSALPISRGAEIRRLGRLFQSNSSLDVVPEPITFPAVDDYELHGQYWGHERNRSIGAVLINGATGLKCSYYSNYAQYLSSKGFNVLIFDYRGVGLSRPKDIRSINATKRDWGLYDTEGAILKLIQLTTENQPLVAVCSSIGGFTLGLAPSSKCFQRALFVGCQYAYWQDYIPAKRMEYIMKWHFIMPLVTMICGYFPGSFFGWSEDLPKGVALEWGLRLHPDFHHFYHLLPHDLKIISNTEMTERMAKLTTEVLTIADINDEFATPAAVNRLMNYFSNCNHRFVQIDSSQLDIGTPMGHVGFFNKRCKQQLWVHSSEWLLHGSHPWKEVIQN